MEVLTLTARPARVAEQLDQTWVGPMAVAGDLLDQGGSLGRASCLQRLDQGGGPQVAVAFDPGPSSEDHQENKAQSSMAYFLANAPS